MSVTEALSLARNRINCACSSRTIRMVCVSKHQPVHRIIEAYNHGVRHFGENYVQELVDKQSNLPSDIAWHFIGHLQTNKVNALMAVPSLYIIESIDSNKLADYINKRVPEHRKDRLRVMVQVNTSGEDSKSGVDPDAVTYLCKHIATKCLNLELTGLMTIGRFGDSNCECFNILGKCRDEILAAHIVGIPKAEEFELSMGMSNDYEIAIKAGATSVRLGRSEERV